MKSQTLLASLMVATGVLSTVLGDIFLKNSHASRPTALLVGTALYALSAVPVAVAFRTIPFGNLFIIWEALNIILGLAIGSTLYAEPLTALKSAAVVFALMALVLASI